MKRLFVASVILTILSAFVFAHTASADEHKVWVCHATSSETNPFVLIHISENAVYGPGGHFNENGTTQAGHEQDLGPFVDKPSEEICPTEVPPTTTTTTVGPTTTEVPPSSSTTTTQPLPTTTSAPTSTSLPTPSSTSTVPATPTTAPESSTTSPPVPTTTPPPSPAPTVSVTTPPVPPTSLVVTTTPTTATVPTELPETGSNLNMLLVALALTLGGGGILAAARRK